jgi:putative ABC transport system permease protein
MARTPARNRPTRLDPAWRKAPFLLLRYPTILAALAFAAFLMALSAGAYPLFLSGVSSRLLRHEIEAPLVGRYGAGVTYKNVNLSLGLETPGDVRSLYEARAEAIAVVAARNPYLGPVEQTVLGPQVSAFDPRHPRRVRTGRLFAGDQVSDHIQMLEGDGGGVLIPQLLARGLRAGPGDPITLAALGRPPLSLTIGGVYRTLSSQPPRGYWRPWEGEIYPISPGGCRADCPLPPQFIMLDRSRLERYVALVPEQDRLSVAWQAPLRRGDPLTMDDAGRMVAGFQRGRSEASDQSARIGQILGCCPPARYYLGRPNVEYTSDIKRVREVVQQRVLSLGGPGSVLRAIALMLALSVLAAAGAFSVNARAPEMRLLSVRGSGPATIGMKAALEGVLPVALGGAAGLGTAFVIARVVAGGSPVASLAVREATMTAAAAIAVAVLGVAVVAGVATLRHAGHRPGWMARVGALPWEVIALGVAVFSAVRLPSSLGSSEVSLDARPPSPFLVVFPLAVIAVVAGLGARLYRRGFAALRRARVGGGRASYLAIRRVAGASFLAVLLVTAGALCVGIFVQSQAVTSSVLRTVETKAKVFVGSDVQAWVDPDTPAPVGWQVPVTRVTRVRQAGTASPGEVPFDLLAVDPQTVARAAYWEDGFADRPFEDLSVALIPTGGEAVPAVVVGPERFAPTSFTMNQAEVPVRVVARASAFPGMSSRRPLVVVDAEAVEEAFRDTSDPLTTDTATTELWIRGTTASAARALEAAGVTPFELTSAREVQDLPRVATIVDTFNVLRALGLAAGALVVAAILLYLQSRQRSQIVAHGLSVRMGLEPAAHRRSLVLELGSMVGAAVALGVGAGLAVAFVLTERLDPLPVVPPDPVFSIPGAAIAGLAVAAAVLAWAGARITAWRVSRVRFGEAMRVAE